MLRAHGTRMFKPLIALGVLALTGCAWHGWSAGAAPLASTEPATQAASPGAVDADGYLQAVDPFEVRIRPKSYGGDLTIVSVAPNGASVKAGDVLIQLDAADLKRQLAAAKNDLLTAQANVDGGEASAKLAEQSDALALRQAQDAVSQADDAVKWWDAVDGPQMLLDADLGLKDAQAGVDDQQDELDELKKMYKSEQLTNATADIVEKRAVRALEMSKARLEETRQQTDKHKTVDYPIARQKVRDAQTSAHYALQQLQIAQTQGAISRKTGLVAVHAALDDAQRKVTELEEDQEKLTVRAPTDGVVIYGAFSQGAFAGDPKSLRVDEKVPAQQVLMMLYRPGMFSALAEMPQAKFGQLHPGLAATLNVEGTGITLHGVCVDGVRTPLATPNGPVYDQTIKLDEVDPTLVPGEHVKVHIELP
jgi:multidrug efflux pump subunit AcrA (membrane-fusion protein)